MSQDKSQDPTTTTLIASNESALAAGGQVEEKNHPSQTTTTLDALLEKHRVYTAATIDKVHLDISEAANTLYSLESWVERTVSDLETQLAELYSHRALMQKTVSNLPIFRAGPSIMNLDPGRLGHLSELLRSQFVTSNTADLKQITFQVEEQRSDPVFPLYLAAIFTSPEEQTSARQLASTELKNDVDVNWGRRSLEVQAAVRSAALNSLGSPEYPVRNAAAGIVAKIVEVEGPLRWPELIPGLLNMVETQQETDVLEGVWTALLRIVEDTLIQLSQAPPGGGPPMIDVMTPRLIPLMKHNYSLARSTSMQILNMIAREMPKSFQAQINQYLGNMAELTSTDTDPDVQRAIVIGLTQLVTLSYDVIEPTIGPIVEYMLTLTQAGTSPDAKAETVDLATSACEFWISMTYHVEQFPKKVAPVRAVLDRLCPVLLAAMVYKQDEVVMLEVTERDEQQRDDRPSDVKPFVGRNNNLRGTAANVEDFGEDDDDDWFDDDDYDDDYDDLDEFGNPIEETTLRSQAAKSCDFISGALGVELVAVMLPQISGNINHEEWPVRSACVVALGAMASGNITAIGENIPTVVDYLLRMLQDDTPFIRESTCWTMVRFASWAVAEAQAGRPASLESMLNALMACSQDESKRVQSAATSGLAELFEVAKERLVPYLEGLLDNLMFLYATYGAKNLHHVYDAISSLCEAVGRNLARPEFSVKLLPPLVDRWQKTEDSEVELQPLMETMCAVIAACGPEMTQYVEGLYNRALKIAHNEVQEKIRSRQQNENYRGDSRFIVSGFEMLSGLCEVYQGNLAGILQPEILFPTIGHAMSEFTDRAVRQQTLALIGDLARVVPEQLRPVAPTFLPTVVDLARASEPVAVANNALWVLGEVIVAYKGELIAPFIPKFCQQVSPILFSDKTYRHLIGPVAATMSRLATVFPEEMIPRLVPDQPPANSPLGGWMIGLKKLEEPEEVYHGIRGLLTIAGLKPQPFLPQLPAFLDLVAGYASQAESDPQLKNDCLQAIQAFKHGLAENWPQALAQLPPNTSALVEALLSTL